LRKGQALVWLNKTINLDDHYLMMRTKSKFSKRAESIFDNRTDKSISPRNRTFMYQKTLEEGDFSSKRSKSPIMINENFSGTIDKINTKTSLFKKIGTLKYNIRNLKGRTRRNKQKPKLIINATGSDLKNIRLPRLVSPLSNRAFQLSRLRNIHSPQIKAGKIMKRDNIKKLSKMQNILQIRTKMISRNKKAENRFNSVKSERGKVKRDNFLTLL